MILRHPLPEPEKPRGRHNNRKMTFDKICRELLFEICREHGLEIEEEPAYGGRKYLEKQEYIIQAQNEKIANQEEMIQSQAEKIMDNETLINEVSAIAYDKAVELVTDQVFLQTREEDIKILDQVCDGILRSPKNSEKAKSITKNVIQMAKDRLQKAKQVVFEKIKKSLGEPEVRRQNTGQIRQRARESILEKLSAHKSRKLPANKENRKQQHNRETL